MVKVNLPSKTEKLAEAPIRKYCLTVTFVPKFLSVTLDEIATDGGWDELLNKLCRKYGILPECAADFEALDFNDRIKFNDRIAREAPVELVAEFISLALADGSLNPFDLIDEYPEVASLDVDED
jgi:hypothetical protein